MIVLILNSFERGHSQNDAAKIQYKSEKIDIKRLKYVKKQTIGCLNQVFDTKMRKIQAFFVILHPKTKMSS